MNNKKRIIRCLIIFTIIVVITTIIVNIKKENDKKTVFENNIATSEVILEKIQFKDITRTYNNGITTIKANVFNNTEEEKSINVKIILKDDKGKQITTMIQVIENIQPKSKKVLQTGITGDYSNVNNIEFKVLTQEELINYDS